MKRTIFSFIVMVVMSLGIGAYLTFGQVLATGSPALLGPEMKHAATAVVIDNFSFSPTGLTIPAGTTVVWTNHDDIPHTVVENNKKFKSKALDTDDAFSYTFSEPGIYEYFCSLHPKMTAKIIVEPK